jgi:DNA polymerase-1
MSIFFRAHHALPLMNTSRGEPTSALYGFSSLFLKIVREQNPASIAFAVDAPQKTFRHGRYEAYKATRTKAPDALLGQFDRLEELLSCLELPVYRVPGFEADDVLATLARRLREQRTHVRIVSGDRDLLQLARETVSVLFTGVRGKDIVLYDAAKVTERFSVLPEQLPSFVALVGDASDNLPGVPGVGPRTAAGLVRKFHDIPTLLDRLDEVTPAGVRASLAANQDQLRLNEELARLRGDVPIEDGPLAFPLGRPAIEKLRRLFDELEFKSLAARLGAIEERIGSEPEA